MKSYKIIFTVVISLIIFYQTIFAQDFLNMTLLGNFGRGEGESKAVFAAGSLVYYGIGNKMQIASFSNPANPVKIGSVILTDIIESLVRTSIGGTQYIVASGGSKMWIINVQNPTTPLLVSTVEVGVSAVCEGIATSGTYAYVAAGGAGFKIYNIAVPSAPVPVASIDSLAYCESVVISSPYAYIAANTTSNFQGRSFIFDISNPANPVYKSTIMGFGGYHQYMNVRAGFAYICDYNAGLQVINVTNVNNPINVTTIPSGYRTAHIIFDGNYGYVAVGDSGIAIYNVVNPASPVFVTKIQTTGRAAYLYYGAISIGGTPTGHIFVSNRNPAPGISAINVSNPSSPVTSSFLPSLAAASGIAYTPYYSNGKVYVAYGSAGLRIIDVTFPSSPVLLSTLPLSGDSRSVVVSGNYAYVAARDSGVHIVDISDASNPVKVRTVKTARARGVAVKGNILFVADSDSGMGLIDISNPNNASLLSYTGSSIYGENVAVGGNFVGLTNYSSITFYDITNPATPVIKGSTASLRIGNEGFEINGNFVYVPDGDSLKIFNIADIMMPALISKVYTGGYGYAAAVAGDYCYVASEVTGVRAINVSNPFSPFEAGYYDFVAQSRGVAAHGKYVYVAEKSDGLTIYSNDLVTSVENDNLFLPEKITLYQNYPNPFNPSTTITYTLPADGFVTLKVYDAIGREVSVLVNEYKSSGVYRVSLDGSSFASGVYICRMNFGIHARSIKMIMIK